MGTNRFFPTLKVIFSLNVHFVCWVCELCVCARLVCPLLLLLLLLLCVLLALTEKCTHTHTHTHTHMLLMVRCATPSLMPLCRLMGMCVRALFGCMSLCIRSSIVRNHRMHTSLHVYVWYSCGVSSSSFKVSKYLCVQRKTEPRIWSNQIF